jgi:hypothetical protein
MDLIIWEIQNAEKRTTHEKLRAMQWTDDPAEMGQWEVRLDVFQQKVLLNRMQSSVSNFHSGTRKFGRQKTSAEVIPDDAMREMRGREIAEASHGWESVQQFREQYQILVRQMPCCGAHCRRQLGEEKNTGAAKLSNLWEIVPAEKGSRQVVQGNVMLRRNGEKISRVALGVEARTDRLKAIGNGQVSLCAATAFELLRERLEQ